MYIYYKRYNNNYNVLGLYQQWITENVNKSQLVKANEYRILFTLQHNRLYCVFLYHMNQYNILCKLILLTYQDILVGVGEDMLKGPHHILVLCQVSGEGARLLAAGSKRQHATVVSHNLLVIVVSSETVPPS